VPLAGARFFKKMGLRVFRIAWYIVDNEELSLTEKRGKTHQRLVGKGATGKIISGDSRVRTRCTTRRCKLGGGSAGLGYG